MPSSTGRIEVERVDRFDGGKIRSGRRAPDVKWLELSHCIYFKIYQWFLSRSIFPDFFFEYLICFILLFASYQNQHQLVAHHGGTTREGKQKLPAFYNSEVSGNEWLVFSVRLSPGFLLCSKCDKRHFDWDEWCQIGESPQSLLLPRGQVSWMKMFNEASQQVESSEIYLTSTARTTRSRGRNSFDGLCKKSTTLLT